MYDIDWKAVENYYFDVMRRVGWLSYDARTINRDGYVRWAHEERGHFRFKDQWHEFTNSRHSMGGGCIWQRFRKEWIPIWGMQYGGWYEKEVTPHLKTVLRSSCDEHLRRPFQGCRGPEEEWIDDTLVYQNLLSPHLEKTFRQFASHERMLKYPKGFESGKSVSMGYHNVSGGAFY